MLGSPLEVKSGVSGGSECKQRKSWCGACHLLVQAMNVCVHTHYRQRKSWVVWCLPSLRTAASSRAVASSSCKPFVTVPLTFFPWLHLPTGEPDWPVYGTRVVLYTFGRQAGRQVVWPIDSIRPACLPVPCVMCDLPVPCAAYNRAPAAALLSSARSLPSKGLAC